MDIVNLFMDNIDEYNITIADECLDLISNDRLLVRLYDKNMSFGLAITEKFYGSIAIVLYISNKMDGPTAKKIKKYISDQFNDNGTIDIVDVYKIVNESDCSIQKDFIKRFSPYFDGKKNDWLVKFISTQNITFIDLFLEYYTDTDILDRIDARHLHLLKDLYVKNKRPKQFIDYLDKTILKKIIW